MLWLKSSNNIKYIMITKRKKNRDNVEIKRRTKWCNKSRILLESWEEVGNPLTISRWIDSQEFPGWVTKIPTYPVSLLKMESTGRATSTFIDDHTIVYLIKYQSVPFLVSPLLRELRIYLVYFILLPNSVSLSFSSNASVKL